MTVDLEDRIAELEARASRIIPASSVLIPQEIPSAKAVSSTRTQNPL